MSVVTDVRPPVVFLTGGHGFVGRHLIDCLASRHPDWAIVCPPGPGGEAAAIDTLDVTDRADVDGWIERTRPDMVVHLAAVAAVSVSSRDPQLAWTVNLGGTLNLLDSLQRYAPAAHLLHMSSADVYGKSAAAGPLTEEALLQPLNPYGASKAAADIAVRQAAAQGLRATVMRPFNQIGPGQSQEFALPNFAAQIARIEAGLQEPVLRTGTLTDERDFIDVRDAVDAYVAALDARDDRWQGEVLNVCSGRARPVGELLNAMIALSPRSIATAIDPLRIRRAPSPRVVGDPTLIGCRLGWAARRAIGDTLRTLLDEARSRLAGQRG